MSDGEEVLVAGRILQGLGGAALMGLSLAIVSTVFPAGERARALGIWAGVSALALGLGPLVGGALVEAVSWRWLFWLNLPFCLLGVALVLAWTAEQRDETATRRIDVAGVTTVALGLAAIVIALVEGAAGVGLLVAFCSSSITSGGRSSSSTCSATGPTSELAPPDSAWSAVTGP
jgi:MFS family permease